VDRRLYNEDIDGSLAHVAMLAKQKIIPASDAAAIRKGLRAIRRELASGKVSFNGVVTSGKRFAAEDIHMAIEERLRAKIGARGGKLHTGRSRNDQVALDERLYLRRTIDETIPLLRTLQKALVRTAAKNESVIMPGYTHLQRAQPVLLAHHLLAYVAMFDRDADRLRDLRRRVNRSPLGAGALAGTPHAIDRIAVARALFFDGIVENSIDAVSDRDGLLEFLSVCAIIMMHLSRLAEECVLWSSTEWSFMEMGESFATGSSIMPQKRNPDMAELVRGKTGRVYGNLVALLTVMKGLPLAYNRDMQEDKEPLFDSARTVADSLHVMAGMIASVRFRKDRFDAELQNDSLLATELADYLVRKSVPFRRAHEIVGSIARHSAEAKIPLSRLPLSVYRSYTTEFEADLYLVLDARKSLVRKKSLGSTSPRSVHSALRRWEKRLRK
jgi:argininosuccinate lyase